MIDLSRVITRTIAGKEQETMVRPEIQAFVALGPLPASDATEETIAMYEATLRGIPTPVSCEEAAALLSSFGPDDCYGLAWTLLHIIESAPSSPLTAAPASDANEWLHRLWQGGEG